MSPWWKTHPKRRTSVCESCRGTEDVHRGLCRRCRARLLADETPGGRPVDVEPPASKDPRTPTFAPPHSRPWVHRGGG